MARGCTCALFFASGPAFLKIFPAAAALSLADLSRQVDLVESRAVRESNGVTTTGKQSKNSLRVMGGVRETGNNFDEVNSLSNPAANKSAKCVNFLASIVATYCRQCIKNIQIIFVLSL